MRSIGHTAALAVAVLAIGAGSLAAAQTSDEIIATRQAGYKHMGDLFGAMKKAIDAKAEVTQFAGPAQEIVDWARKIPTLFPDGTQQGHDTHARPEIWSDRAGFDKASTDLLAQAEKLVLVAKDGDKDAFAEQWKATGATCGACHRNYRTRYN